MTSDEKPKFPEELVTQAERQIIEQSKRIDFYITEYSLELLAIKMNNGDFEVPDHQRESTWEDDRKSRFIESILMGFPVPYLFFWGDSNTGRLEIVDGLHRLRTIQQFLANELILGDLGKLSLLSGFSFNDLPESRQRKVKNKSIRGIILDEHTDEQSRLDLFERCNTGSKIVNEAE